MGNNKNNNKKSWYGFGPVLVRVRFCKNTVFYDVFEQVGTGVGTGWSGFGPGWFGLVRVASLAKIC